MLKYPTIEGIEKITLERLRCHLGWLISIDLLADMNQVEFEAHLDYQLKNIALSLEMKLAGEKLKEVKAQYPADWKEAVKERFAPKWFKERRPVKYKEIILTAHAVYPLISLPEEKNFVDLNKCVLSYTEKD